jgi:hypothetical protein
MAWRAGPFFIARPFCLAFPADQLQLMLMKYPRIVAAAVVLTVILLLSELALFVSGRLLLLERRQGKYLENGSVIACLAIRTLLG